MNTLFGDLSVAFFDTNSLYFEGQGGESLGQRGHSKDYRPQLNQVVLGIVLDQHDRPIASFLLPGNTADVTTLLPVVYRLNERFGITKACVVADRGMISAETIARLEAAGVDYILGARERSTKEVYETVMTTAAAAVPLAIPRQKGATELEIKDVSVEGLRAELVRRLAPQRPKDIECLQIVDDLADLSVVDVEQDGKRCRLRTAQGPSVDAVCRAVGVALPHVYQEIPPAKPVVMTPESCGAYNFIHRLTA